MRDLTYYAVVMSMLGLTMFMVLSMADSALRQQDIICQEGC